MEAVIILLMAGDRQKLGREGRFKLRGARTLLLAMEVAACLPDEQLVQEGALRAHNLLAPLLALVRPPPAVAINGAQGLSPDKSSCRTSTCGAGAARAHIQSPTPGAASHAPVPAVHVEVLPPPAVAIESS